MRALALALGLLLLFPWLLAAQEDTWAASVKLYHLQTDPAEGGLSQTSFKTRTGLRQPLGEGLLFSLAYEVTALSATVAPPPRPYRWDDLNPDLWTGENQHLAQNLDRAALNLTTPALDLTLGRQPLAFGNARLVNPTDVFTGFALGSLDQEDRPGLDAARLQVPLGSLTELDLGLLAGPQGNGNQGGGFVKTRLRLWEQDVTLMAAKYGPHQMTGFDLTFPLAAAGVWLEAARTQPAAFAEAPQPDAYWRWVTGLDCAFPQNVYAWAEVHHNGAGQADPKNYPLVQANAAYTSANGFLWGRDYLSLGLAWQPHPLLSLQGNWLQNQNDGSLFVSLGGEYSIQEDWFAETGLLQGSKQPDSEFGATPPLAYVALRWYL